MLVEYGCDINVVYSINIHKYFLYPSRITNKSFQGGIIEYYMLLKILDTIFYHIKE